MTLQHPIMVAIRRLRMEGKRPCVEQCGRQADSGAYCFECRCRKATDNN